MASNAEPDTVSVRFIKDLLYSLSHDFGANVRHVVQFSKLLESDQDNAEFLGYVSGAGEKLQLKLAALTAMSRLAFERDNEILVMADVFDRALDTHRTKMSEGKLEVAAVGDWPGIIGREDQWTTVVKHLLDNAITFHPLDPDHIRNVVASCDLIDDRVVFSIEDNGVGVSPSQYEVITRPFKRLQILDNLPGKGMGLAYCDFIAEITGGELTFTESPMGGLKVTFSQPVIDN